MNIDALKKLRESEDHVEFKEAKGGSYSYNGGTKTEIKERRKCILGYVVAFANEGGGKLIFGMSDKYPHEVVGTNQCLDATGKLESEIYRDTGIRVEITEMYDEENRRVLVIKVPSRPIGKIFKFEDVALMRVGEELGPMSEVQYLKIIQEQEPDFSEKICEGAVLEDLDDNAINILRDAYARKNNNEQFYTLSKIQLLSDLELITENKITNAALVLVGKNEAIKKFIPQSSVFLEYRNLEGQITFDNRIVFQESYFNMIEKLWDAINARNGKVPVQQGPYIFDIPFFNKEVIREAINNSITHRDYRVQSEVVIKQYPNKMVIANPGGFPKGVSLENLINVNSTPRNRRLADVLQRTGVVERAGQGIDKIFYQSLSEAKGTPDYTKSDNFQVELILSSMVKDKAFALFIDQIQRDRVNKDKLSVQEIICLDKVREGIDKVNLDFTIVQKLQ